MNDADMAKLIAAMQANQQPPAGAITFGGINKYWPQLVGMVLVGLFLWNQGEKQQILIGRISSLEEKFKEVPLVKDEQSKTGKEVQQLQIAVNSINEGQKKMADRMETIGADLRAVAGQVGQLSQELRSGKR